MKAEPKAKLERWSVRNIRRAKLRLTPTAVAEGERRKSASTRERILESAIRCLVKDGYQKLSLAAVAEGAGLTRAAAIYHFPNREAVLRATVDYLIDKRLKRYWEAVQSVPEGEEQIAAFVDIYWEQVNDDLFRAFIELLVASRTDAALDAIVRPALQLYEAERMRYSRMIFSHEMQKAAGDRFDTIRDIARFLIEGMAFAGMTTDLAPERIAPIKAFVVTQMTAAYSRDDR